MLAEDQVDFVTSIVYGKLQTVFGWAEKARTAALEAIGAIGQFPVPVVQMNLPTPPKLASAKSPGAGDPPDTVVKVTPIEVHYTQTGQVAFVTPEELPPMEYGVAVAPPPAPTDPVPTPPTLYPQAAIPVVPDPPSLFNPAEPVLTNASPPALLHVDVPDFTFPVLPPFDAPFPDYAALLPKAIAPVEPILKYPPVPTGLKDQILALLNGGTEALSGVQEAMIDKLVESTDIEAQKAIDTAFSAAAGRNFSLPYGVLVDGVNDIRVAAAQKIRDGMSDINNKIAQEALKNYQAGMELALILEKAYISFYMEYARQILEAEKINVQIHLELFNAAVALFNAQQQVRTIHASAWKAQVDGIIAGMGSYPTAIEGAIAETEENSQRIQMYAADGGLVKARTEVYTATTKKQLAPIEMYKAEVGGVQAQANIVVANVESYRAAVGAYAAGVEATVEVVNAFAAETQAKSSQVSVYTANAKAYSQYIKEGAQRANTWKVFANEQGAVLRANVQSFQSAADANQAFIRAQASEVSAQAEIATARASAYSNGVQGVKAYNRAVVENAAAAQTYAMVAAENATRAMSLAAIAQAETDRINAGAQAAQTQALAGLAQGSMSAMHVSASAEGSGAMAASAGWQQGTSSTWGGSKSFNEDHNESLSA